MINYLVEKYLERRIHLRYMEQDLKQTAIKELIEIFDKFDRKRGCRFITYACPCIKRRIWKEVNKERYVIKMVERRITYEINPLYILSDILTSRELEVCRLLQSDESMTNADIGRKMGVSRERVRQIRNQLKSNTKLRTILRDLAA